LTPVLLQTISTIAIWVPLLMALLKLKTGDTKFRLFFVFLVFGALVDGFGMTIHYFLPREIYYYHGLFQFFYLWFEALFFVWLCFHFLAFDQKDKWRNLLFVGFSVLFSLEFFIRFLIADPNIVLSSFIYSFFLVVSSFLSAFALLRIAENRGDLLKYSWFWILSGIFFYSFGSFFVDILSYASFNKSIWPIKIFSNLIQYAFFVVGIVRVR
jgi:hypothetical protein